MLTPEEQAELDHLDSILGTSAPREDSPGLTSRFGQDVANIPSGIANQLIGGATGLRNMLDPAPWAQTQPWKVPNFFDVPQARTLGEKGVDLIPKIAETVGAALIPGGAVAKVGRLAGMTEGGAALLGDFAGGAYLAAPQGPAESAGTGAEFTALGLANRVPSIPGRIAANLAVPVAGQLLRGQNPLDQQSLINTGANIAVPAILGQYGRRMEGRELLRRQENAPPSPIETDPETGFQYQDGKRLAPEQAAPVSPEPNKPDLIQRDTSMAGTGRDWPTASLLRPPDEVQPAPTERGFLIRPASQYLAGASGGALAGPLVDQDPDKPAWEKMLEGAGVGLGAVAAGRGGARALLRRAPEPVATSIDDVARIGADRFKGVTLRMVKNEGELPPDWQAAIQPSLDSGQRHEALYSKRTGEVYLLKDNLADPTRAAKVVAHEVAAHHGVDQILSEPEWKGVEDSVVKPGNQLAESVSQQYMGTSDLSSLDANGRRRVAREYLGRLAENTSLNPNLWEKIKTGVSRATRAMGSERDWSDSELQGLIQRGAKRAEAPEATSLLTSNAPEASLVPTKQAGQEQERGNPSVGGKIRRLMEQNFGLGQSASTRTAEELGKGHAQLLRKHIEPLIPLLKKADTNEQAAISLFGQSQPTPQSVALLRANVRPEIADAVERAGSLITQEQKLAGIHPEDPTYRTTRYAAFQDPKRWVQSLKANPQLRQDYIDQLIRDNELPGFSTEDVAQAVDEYTADIQRGNDFSSATASNSKIGRDIFMGKKDLSAEHQKFLGEYENPAQQIAFTLQKLANSAAQAKKIATLAEMGAKGELDIMDQATRQQKVAAAQQAGDTATVEKLGALHRMPANRAFGALAGKYMPTDVLDSMNAHNELWTGGWLKTFSGPTSIIKQSMTVFNPATHVRQWIQTPLIAAMARVAPQDFFAAGRAIRAKGAEWEELVRNHIVGADFSSAELARGATQMDAAFNQTKAGKAAEVWRAIKGGAQKAYGLPDNLVRAAAYLKQKPRFFAEGNAAGLKGAELEQFAQRKAMEFTNRYTMNYGAVSNAVKVARETPFVSPFISYQAEMLRILKNLGEDAIHGSASDRVWALGNIAGLVAMPLMAAAYAKGQLSDADQKEWDRVQRLSPKYASGQIRVPLSRKQDGSFRYLNIANLVPAGDIAALARNFATGDVSGLLESNPYVGWEKTPVFNTITEQVTGRDSVTDAKLDKAGRAGSLVKNILPPWVPPGYEGKRILQSLTPNDQGGLGITNARTGQSATPGLELLRLGGIPLSDVQPRQLLRRAAADERDKEMQIKNGSRQLMGSDASAEAKQKAQAKALLKMKDAREEYQRLLR